MTKLTIIIGTTFGGVLMGLVVWILITIGVKFVTLDLSITEIDFVILRFCIFIFILVGFVLGFVYGE